MLDAVTAFVCESNMIEGINRDPTADEVGETRSFLLVPLQMASVIRLQAVYAPKRPLRDKPGMDVRVGRHVAPRGGPGIPLLLQEIVGAIAEQSCSSVMSGDPWVAHNRFETLHPFMDGNGRTGRALWARHMLLLGRDPFVRPFLHSWYYQTLEHADGRQGV